MRTAVLDTRTGRFVRWDDGVLMTWWHREDARVWIGDSPYYIPADAPADDAAPSVVRAYELRLVAAYERGVVATVATTNLTKGQIMQEKNYVDVWLRIPDGHEEAEAEANVRVTETGYAVDWYLTAVGLVKTVEFDTLADAYDWLEREGFANYN